MFNRDGRDALLERNASDSVGTIIFSPLAGGLLTAKYLKGVPEDSRAANDQSPFLNADRITREIRDRIVRLNDLATDRGQTLAQLALAWVLRHPETTSALIGASRPSQVLGWPGRWMRPPSRRGTGRHRRHSPKLTHALERCFPKTL